MTEYSDGDYLYGADLDNLVENTAHNGVLTGLGVTENTPTPDMNVVVAAGSGFAGETYFSKGSSTVVPITAAHATLDRLDLIVVNSAGTISAVAGVAATPPNPPDLPDNSILLAIVEVDNAVTQIFNADIIDRILLLGSIQEEHIGDGEIKVAKIADASITDAKINTGSWTYAKKDAAETITGGYTFQGITKFEERLVMRTGNFIRFLDSNQNNRGEMWALTGGQLEIGNAADGQVYLRIQVNSATGAGGVVPTVDQRGNIGTSLRWSNINACNFNDTCSEIFLPKRALETLNSIMLQEVGAKIREEPDKHILKSEKLPKFLRSDKLDKKGELLEKGMGKMRNLSASISFNQACIYELLERLEVIERAE